MKLTLGCGCRFDLNIYIYQLNHVLDIVSDDDRIRLCVKHMNLLIDDYVKLIKKMMTSKSLVEDSSTVKTFKEKERLIKLYKIEYPKRLQMLKDLDKVE